ncbi:MAG: hypothetical protein QME78_07395 [Thermodesulfobacteriota bacterium]|nr:hypothetical protein [Thermodesulfobacteriota bacterium]
MSSRYGVLSFLLFLAVLLLAFKNYETWWQPQAMTSRKEAVGKTGAKAEVLPATGSAKGKSAGDSLGVISEKNIFNPDRKEFPILAQEQPKPPSRPPIQLSGVMIADDVQTASIVNPGRPLPKGERATKTLKIGDQVGDYKLTRIMPDRVTFEAPGDTYEVLLYDPKAPKRRAEVKTPVKPAEITSALPGPAPTALTGPAPAVPRTIPPAVLPVPKELPREQQRVEPVMPIPASPVPPPDPSVMRGVRPARPGPLMPGASPGGGGN